MGFAIKTEVCDPRAKMFASPRNRPAKGARIRSPPQNFSWAYEFAVEDPDGHVLRFGAEPKP